MKMKKKANAVKKGEFEIRPPKSIGIQEDINLIGQELSRKRCLIGFHGSALNLDELRG